MYKELTRDLGAQKAQKAIKLIERIKVSADFEKLSDEERDFLRFNGITVSEGRELGNGYMVAKVRFAFRRVDGQIITVDLKKLDDEIPYVVDWEEYDGTIIWSAGLTSQEDFADLDEVQRALREMGYAMPNWGTYLATGGSVVENIDMYGVSHGYTVQEEISCDAKKDSFRFFFDEDHDEDAEEWFSHYFTFRNRAELRKKLFAMQDLLSESRS